MLRSEFGPARPRSWWLSLFTPSDTMATEFVKANAKSVADVMTRDVISVKEDTPIGDVARILEERHIKRVPVLRGADLVGIVSRADLVRALAAAEPVAQARADRSDEHKSELHH